VHKEPATPTFNVIKTLKIRVKKCCIGNKLKEPPKKPKVSLGDFTGKEPAGGFIGNDDIYEIGIGNGNYSELPGRIVPIN
jgi:hypothetical protein